MVDKLIKRKEAAEMLGISLDTLDHARMEGLITYVQYVENGCVYFTEVGLQEYIARSTHRARPKDNNPTFRKREQPGAKFDIVEYWQVIRNNEYIS